LKSSWVSAQLKLQDYVEKAKKIIKLSLSYLQFFILCDSNTTNERTNLVSSASVILYPKIGSYAIIKNNIIHN
jgi:predicted RNase H-related nuclease YkuK (DUF458 family)